MPVVPNDYVISRKRGFPVTDRSLTEIFGNAEGVTHCEAMPTGKTIVVTVAPEAVESVRDLATRYACHFTPRSLGRVDL